MSNHAANYNLIHNSLARIAASTGRAVYNFTNEDMKGCPQPNPSRNIPPALYFRVAFSGNNGEFVRISRIVQGDETWHKCAPQEIQFVQNRISEIAEKMV